MHATEPSHVPCYVYGLTSEAGRALNGRTGFADITPTQIARASADERFPVRFGDEVSKLLKRSNLKFATVSRDVSGAGQCTVTLSPFSGSSSIVHMSWGSTGPTKKKLANLDTLEQTTVPFGTLNELPSVLQFLLACGPAVDLVRAKDMLSRIETPALLDLQAAASEWPNARALGKPDQVLKLQPPPVETLVEVDVPACTRLSADVMGRDVVGLGQLRAPGVGLTALEWAAKRGNFEIAEWLSTDERSRVLVHTGAPVGWACYEGHVELARMLVSHGADPMATDVVLWRAMPPILAAASKGQEASVRFLHEEMGASIHTTDEHSLGILHHIHGPEDWEQRENHVATDTYARARGAKKQYFRNFQTR